MKATSLDRGSLAGQGWGENEPSMLQFKKKNESIHLMEAISMGKMFSTPYLTIFGPLKGACTWIMNSLFTAIKKNLNVLYEKISLV